MIVNLGTIPNLQGDYIITEPIEAEMLEFLVNKPPDRVRDYIRRLSGIAKILLDKKVRVQKIDPETFPEYYI